MPGEPHGLSSVAVARHGPPLRPVAGEGRRLTDQQAEFVMHFTSSAGAIGNAAESCRRAGYSPASAREIGRQLLDKPHLQAAIREENLKAISGSLTSKAVALLERVLDDEEAPIKVRVEAAKTILDRAGFAASPIGPRRPNDKQLAEMTADELRETMRQARAEMDKGLTVIDSAVTVNATTETEGFAP